MKIRHNLMKPLLGGILAAALCGSALTSAAAPQTLFTENFNSPAPNSVLNSLPGWEGYISKKAYKLSEGFQYNYNNDAPTPNAGVTQARLLGNYTDNPVAGAAGGYLNVNTTNASGALGTPIIAAVRTGLDISLTAYDDLTVSWKGVGVTANGAWADNPITTRVLIQVGGQWYASAAEYALSGGGYEAALNAAEFSSFVITPDPSAWLTFSLVPSTLSNSWGAADGVMGVGDMPVTSLSGSITGIGLLTTFPTFASDGIPTSASYDQLSITGVPVIPEPRHAAMLAGFVILLLALRRIRR